MNGRAQLEFVETCVARWVHVEISIREYSTMDQLVDCMLDKAREAASAFEGPTVVRCTLRGNGALHRDLQRDEMSEELRSLLQTVVAAETVRIATGPELDFESVTRTETMVSDFLKLADRALEDPDLRQRLTDSLMPLFRRREMPAIDDARLREWLERASALGVDLLLES
jgi:hypothetical protein